MATSPASSDPATVTEAQAGTGHGVMDRGELARAVASAAGATPGVARLVGGPGVEVATHYPGGKVVGVGMTPAAVVVHLSVDRVPLHPITAAVGRAVAEVLRGGGDPRPVEVVVEDIEDLDTLPEAGGHR